MNREVDVLKAVLQAAVQKYLKASPLYGMKRLRGTTPNRRLLREDEEARLLAVMRDDDKALFLVGLDALVRLADILDVQWKAYQETRLYIADPKTGGGFHVPLSQRARAALDAIKPSFLAEGLCPPDRADADADARRGLRDGAEDRPLEKSQRRAGRVSRAARRDRDGGGRDDRDARPGAAA